MNRLYQILVSRYASIFCILFAFANRTALAIFASNIGRDKQLQLTMAENLVSGHGLTIIKYFTKDLYTPVYDSSQVFPPGYSIIIIPFLKLFNNNAFFACTVLDVIAAVGFVIVFRNLCKKLSLPVYLVNIATIIAGCSQYIFFMDAGSTDVISLTLTLAGFIVSLNIINSNEKPTFLTIAGYGLLFFLPSFFRYMYIALSPLLPLLILFWGFYSRQNQLKATGLRLLCFVLVLQVVMILSLSSHTSEFIYPSVRGIFPEQLLQWYPFFLASFINIDFAAQRMELFPDIDYTSAINMFELFNLAVIPILISVIRNTLIKRKSDFFFAGWWHSIPYSFDTPWLFDAYPQTTNTWILSVELYR